MCGGDLPSPSRRLRRTADAGPQAPTPAEGMRRAFGEEAPGRSLHVLLVHRYGAPTPDGFDMPTASLAGQFGLLQISWALLLLPLHVGDVALDVLRWLRVGVAERLGDSARVGLRPFRKMVVRNSRLQARRMSAIETWSLLKALPSRKTLRIATPSRRVAFDVDG
jgi:hypothetical protein